MSYSFFVKVWISCHCSVDQKTVKLATVTPATFLKLLGLKPFTSHECFLCISLCLLFPEYRRKDLLSLDTSSSYELACTSMVFLPSPTLPMIYTTQNLVSSAFWPTWACGGLNESVSQRLMYLKAWCPVGGAVLERFRTCGSLEDIYHWRWDLEFKYTCRFSGCLYRRLWV